MNVENFYPVPDVFGKNKKDAERFHRNWNRFVGKSQLIFTRQPEGRRILLKARLFHHSNELQDNLKDVTIWN
ncbi:hypothetical protein ACFQ1Q_04480 [Winogradskyella litorisediminis]|uniref:Uncharacterized protein n=1 Tax=Winogradskyella litorisediminis TaxID=1156618 RepID=A0ABW3N488_9FLAO